MQIDQDKKISILKINQKKVSGYIKNKRIFAVGSTKRNVKRYYANLDLKKITAY